MGLQIFSTFVRILVLENMINDQSLLC